MFARIAKSCLAIAAGVALPLSASAEETPVPGVSMELSSSEDMNGGCRMSFVVTNGHEADIGQAVYEIVLFGTGGGVAQMTLLDFRELPSGRPRVRQFQFDGVSCDAIPRILINGAETCTGVPERGCIDRLILRTRTATELIG